MTCWKKTFASKGDALHAELGHDELLRPYQCPRCKLWHLTSEKQTRHLDERPRQRKEPYKRRPVWEIVREAEMMD